VVLTCGGIRPPCRVELGPWSADLLRPLAIVYRWPLNAATIRVQANPATLIETSRSMTPKAASSVADGARHPHTSGSSAARDAPSSFAHLDQVLPPRERCRFGDAVGEPWRGARPTLPDSLP